MRPRGAQVALLLTTPGWRGSGISFRKIAAGLVGRGHDVMIIAGDAEAANRLDQAGVMVHHVPTGDTGRREVGAVRRLLAAHRSRVVLADAPRDVRIARYASLFRRRAIAWRYNLHGRTLATDPLQLWLFRGLDHVTHLSDYGKARLAATTPWLARVPASVIPNGFATGELVPDASRRSAWRERHGLAPEARLVLTPTPALPEKSVEVAAAAMAGVTGATWAVTDTLERLETIGAAAPSSTLALGRLDPEALHEAMRAADVVLLPAAAELFGNVTAEAMALECAVVAADGGATPEVVGEAGVLFEAGDAAAVRDAVRTLLDDPDQRRRLGTAARARIGERFPLAAMVEQFDELVRGLDEIGDR